MRRMQILVQTRDGRKSIYEVDRFGTVGHLKARIGRTMAVPMGFSRLTYKGRILANQSVLEDVGIKRMSTLDLFWQPVVLTPKQLSDKEGDLDKLEQKQRTSMQSSSLAESYDQMVKTGGLLKGSDSFQDGEGVAGGEIPNPAGTPLTQEEDEDELLEDLILPSSDGLDFLALTGRPKKSDDHIEKDLVNMVDLVPIAAPLPDPLVDSPPKKPETSAPSKSIKLKLKGKKNRKKK
ncbi:uncharacterized protein LOC108039326 [Drosophila rhopaloa]|uniref:Uncharacterized protein LOC108039326 n=1 Tax=Drosophila rhopaloa TaxID=1041015 RepID=A0A6P4E1D6_DRORH|nr:uncharacterized protein LOC108039326 [Drosophila rhopaloa]